MGTTLYGVHTQGEFAAALAEVSRQSAAGGAYTIVLTGSFAIAGTLAIALATDAASLTIATAGNVISGSGTLSLSGRGTLVMAGSNTFTGGIDFASGTLDLAARGGAGSGRIHLTGGIGLPQTLRIHGTDMPINPIAIEYGGQMSAEGRNAVFAAVDLVDISATAQYASFADDGSITIPTAAGPVRLTFTAARSIGVRGGSRVSLLPDGNGGTLLESIGQFPDAAVTILGAAGTAVATGFDDLYRNATVQTVLANLVSAGVIAGTTHAMDFAGGVLPGWAGGTIEALVHQNTVVALPDTPSVLVSDAPGAVSVIGGAADGQLVLAGAGGVVFVSGTGQGSVVAGGGNSLVNIQPGNPGQYVDLGGGNDTVVASGGNNVISAGLGHNMLWLGAGGAAITARGDDTIVGGAGNALIDATTGPIAANVLAWLGSGGSLFSGGAGRSTIIGGAGNDTMITAQGASQLWLGSGTDNVSSAGQDTVIGGTGSATVVATHGLVYGGAGNMLFSGAAATGSANTVVGGSGAATVNGADIVFGGAGPMVVNPIITYGVPLGSYATTVVGGSGAETVNGAAAMFAGTGPLQFNSLANATVVGNAGGRATVSTSGNYASMLLYANGSTTFSNDKAPYPSYTGYFYWYYAIPVMIDTVVGVGGTLTVPFATGALISAPTGGGSTITVGGLSTVIGGGNGDVITAMDAGAQNAYHTYQTPYFYYPQPAYAAAAPVLLIAGAGAETISAAGFRGAATLIGGSGPDLLIGGDGDTTIATGTGPTTIVGGNPFSYTGGVGQTRSLFTFAAGNANTVQIEHFQASADFISLPGFPAGEATTALAGATIQGSDTLLTLSDGTSLTFVGFTGLSAANFI